MCLQVVSNHPPVSNPGYGDLPGDDLHAGSHGFTIELEPTTNQNSGNFHISLISSLLIIIKKFADFCFKF